MVACPYGDDICVFGSCFCILVFRTRTRFRTLYVLTNSGHCPHGRFNCTLGGFYMCVCKMLTLVLMQVLFGVTAYSRIQNRLLRSGEITCGTCPATRVRQQKRKSDGPCVPQSALTISSHLSLQLEHTIQQCFRCRRASRNVNVNRDNTWPQIKFGTIMSRAYG